MMKLLVLFGSRSDEYIYGPLIEKLSQKFEVDMRVISAHRDPDLLADVLKNVSYDAIVAGAGLAAHLPGVVASKTDRPVFGIPVDACFGGLDALLSIQQMPFGVPVLACGVSKWTNISEFLTYMESMKAKQTSPTLNMHLVVNEDDRNYEYVSTELQRTLEYAKSENVHVTVSRLPSDESLNIWMVTRESELKPDAKGIYVPIIEKTQKDAPATALKIMNWVNMGGLWVGVNNTRNAVKFFKKFES